MVDRRTSRFDDQRDRITTNVSDQRELRDSIDLPFFIDDLRETRRERTDDAVGP